MTHEKNEAGTDPTVVIRRLAPEDVSDYRALMLEAYSTEAEAFTSTVHEREMLPLDWWKARVTDKDDAKSVVYGALADGQLVGAVGLYFEQRERTRHKATLYGTFVRPAYRGRGVARRLVAAVVDHARAAPHIRQVLLRVTASNRSAIGLYEAFEFRSFGTEPDANRVGDRFVAVTNM